MGNLGVGQPIKTGNYCFRLSGSAYGKKMIYNSPGGSIDQHGLMQGKRAQLQQQ